MKKIVILAALGSLALAGCTKKTGPADAGSYTPGGAVSESESGDPEMDSLQANLVASAGSDRVFFDFDEYTLSPESRQTLNRHAAWLRQHPQVSFSIEGHCDERGTREYNLALGDRRARAAADYLVALGISPTRIRTISYGKERPDALGSDDRSHALNRRAVSIVIRTGS